jgi:hypothetical protein
MLIMVFSIHFMRILSLMSQLKIDYLECRIQNLPKKARDYFVTRSILKKDTAFSLAEAEYAAGLDVLETLVDGEGRFTSLEASLIVGKALETYRSNLNEEGFPLTRRCLSLLIDKIEAKEAPENDLFTDFAPVADGFT